MAISWSYVCSEFSLLWKGRHTPFFKKRGNFLSFTSFCHLHLFLSFKKTQFLFIHICPFIHPVIRPVIPPVICLVISPGYTPGYLPGYPPDYPPSYLPSYMPGYLPGYPPGYPPCYPPSYLPSYPLRFWCFPIWLTTTLSYPMVIFSANEIRTFQLKLLFFTNHLVNFFQRWEQNYQNQT